ncbi:dienelactone hydrolase family protein [Catenulispora subtropica]|uniref:dienelactone hydrolase family protein n=1 Tax=Catenulispora subtropica TaxID=450798 RepID=UPI0031D84A7C
MCHDPASHPPVFEPASGPVASRDTLVLTSSDGSRFSAFHAVPGRPGRPHGTSVLVLPDNRGLTGFYEELCIRLAEQGHPAMAIDYYGRSAGPDHRARDDAFPFMEHLFRVTREGLFADIRAGIAALRNGAGGTNLDATAPAEVAVLGFCFGGRQAFLTAAPEFGTRGAIGFYGFPDELFGAPGPTQLADGLTAPILGLFGGADAGISAEHVAAFGRALGGTPHEFVTYPGMPHSFFDQPADAADPVDPVDPVDVAGPSTPADPDGARAAACADAWRRVLAFLA